MFGDVDVKYLEPVLAPLDKVDNKYIEAIKEYGKNNYKNALNIMDIIIDNSKDCKKENKHSGIFDFSFSNKLLKHTYINLVKLIIDKNEFNENKIKIYRQSVISQPKDYILHFVFFFKKDDDSIAAINEYRKQLKNSDVIRNKDVRVSLFEDFIEEQFGDSSKEKINELTNDIKKEIRESLGFHAMPIPKGEVFSSFIESLKNTISNYDYLKVKKDIYNKLSQKYNDFKDIEIGTFNYILNNFRSRYEILIGSKDFSKSFITSSWLYEHYYKVDTLDNTFIISGYIKAIESFMYEFIKASNGEDDYDNFIKKQKIKDIKTLGCLEYYLSNWYISDKYFSNGIKDTSGETLKNYKDYFRTLIRTIREDYRNNNFHIESLEASNISEIRDLSIYTLMILIGGLNIPMGSNIYKRLLTKE